MSTPDPTKKLRALAKGVEPAGPGPVAELRPEHADPVLHELVYSMLLWEATPSQALNALKRLLGAVVDYNELRICMPDEIAGLLGPRYPLVEERAARLKAALHHVYNLEHEVTLARLPGLSKREARAYLDALEGVPPFVAARVTLVALGGHAAPLDQRLYDLLVAHGAIDEEPDLPSAASKLERAVRASDSAELFALLDAWRDTAGTPTPARRPRPATASKSAAKAAKKTSSKKAPRARGTPAKGAAKRS